MSFQHPQQWDAFAQIQDRFYLPHYPLHKFMHQFISDNTEQLSKTNFRKNKTTSSEKKEIPRLLLESEQNIQQQIQGRCRIGTSQDVDMILHSGNSTCSQKIRDLQGEIFWDGRRYILQDHSQSQIHINEKKLQKQQIPLRQGDCIQFHSRDVRWNVNIFYPQNTRDQTSFLSKKTLVQEPFSQNTIFGLSIKQRLAKTVEEIHCISLTWQNTRYELDQEWQTLGRDPKAYISIPEPMISFQHVEFLWSNHSLYIRDMGSTNGTFWNEEQVTIPQKITSPGILRCGTLEFPIDVQKNVSTSSSDEPTERILLQSNAHN